MFNFSNSINSWCRDLKILLDSLPLLNPLRFWFSQHHIPHLTCLVPQHDHISSVVVWELSQDGLANWKALSLWELLVDGSSGWFDSAFWDILLLVGKRELSLAVGPGFAGLYLAPGAERSVVDILDGVEVVIGGHFGDSHSDEESPLDERSELVLPDLDDFERAEGGVSLSEELDECGLFLLDG